MKDKWGGGQESQFKREEFCKKSQHSSVDKTTGTGSTQPRPGLCSNSEALAGHLICVPQFPYLLGRNKDGTIS